LRSRVVVGLKIVWGCFFLLTSLYCLLAYMPYTYCALVKAPPYAWLTWFVHHHVVLYWVAVGAASVAFWPGKKSSGYLLPLGLQVLGGIYLTFHPVLANLQNDSAAYFWSLAALLPLGLAIGSDLPQYGETSNADRRPPRMLAYSGAILAAVVVALLYALGAQLRHRMDLHSWSFHPPELELTVWSLVSHVVLAVAIVTVLNLLRMASWKTSRPRHLHVALLGLLVGTVFAVGLLGFLDSAFGFQGWQARVYAGALAATLTLLGLSVWMPLQTAQLENKESARRFVLPAITVALAVAAVVLPAAIGDGDWNGVLQSTFTVLFWAVLSVCLYRLRPRSVRYSGVTIAAVVIFTAFAYKGMQATAILWAKPLGPTDDDISRKIDNYAAQDVSFDLAYHLLGNGRGEACRDLCRILRANTNIRDAQAKTDLNLVDQLSPAAGKHPNIFIFVIDSMRPDYLGAYNSKVDFTPNLDALARDSVVFRNAYTEYAGTTLSEPAIWSGALLLHAHYLQPFSKVNSLEKMARTDGYQTVVSYDTVLRELFSSSDDLVKLDTDKLWNGYEACSTVQQTEHYLETRADPSRPVLFYAQPMNVHQFARNDVPSGAAAKWRMRPGMNNRIAYEVSYVDGCLGGFVNYLKKANLYDNSFIVVTADHGDATGEFGRHSHSLWIYPEIMRVPLIIHLPREMQGKFVYDDSRITTLTDVTPSLYYLLGHRPIVANPLFGRPLFTKTRQELDSYQRDELFLASDARAVYGILSGDGRYLYATYDAPAASYLFDLKNDPNAEHSILTDAVKQQYDERIIGKLQQIADFYGYKAGIGSLLAAGHAADRPRGYIRVRGSDGFMHDIPASDFDAMKRKDPTLSVVPQ